MWKKILEEGDVTWGDILNKPVKYPPTDHTHPEYAESKFVFNGSNYDLHYVITQVVKFLKDNYGFTL